MSEEFPKQPRGPYLCFTLGHEFGTAHALRLKSAIATDLKEGKSDFAMDSRELQYIDPAGLKFFHNLEDTLGREGRQLVFFGVQPDVLKEHEGDHEFHSFPSLEAFERGFHEINPQLQQSVLKLARGKGTFRTIELACPLCNHEDVAGFTLDESRYDLAWSDEEIVPVLVPQDDGVQDVDWPVYQVAVCPNCFFASSRIDWFRILLPEGNIPSTLKASQIDTLSNSVGGRRTIAITMEEVRSPGFFRMPRESKAAYMSWKLNEFTHRHVSVERKHNDGFEIAVSNFMMCKYTSDPREVDERMHTAMAWLQTILQTRIQYSTQRVARTYTYAVSALLAMDKAREARALFENFQREFTDEAEFGFWLQRCRDLIADDLRLREQE